MSVNPFDIIRVGQVWRDCDKRMHGRKCKVVELIGSGMATKAVMRNVAGGRDTRISVHRMYRHSSGWELVR